MTEKNLRLFFAVNLPEELKLEISEKLLPLIPKDKWRKTLPENLHITIHFLGHLPKKAVAGLESRVKPLSKLERFEAEICCAGHFKGNILWLGFGRGTESFNLLNSKLQECLGTHDSRFHAHITLARNRGANKKSAEALVQSLRQALPRRAIRAKSLDLMQSELRKAGPEYKKLFSVEFTQALQ